MVKVISQNNDVVFKPAYILMTIIEENNAPEVNTVFVEKFSAYAMLVSCFFLLLVLIVYSLLPQLRRIGGMILMAYIVSLMASFLLKAGSIIFYELIYSDVCMVYTPIMYFTILSGFFWLNIMSFDIWWTFRGSRKNRDIHRRGELVKFLWYSLYAWGTPAVMSAVASAIDHAKFVNWPTFVKPHFESCLYAKYETIIYQYIPLFVLIAINCILYIMTIYNIWLIERGIGNFNPIKNTKNRNRYKTYIALSSVMGVSWVLELIHLFVANEAKSVVLYIAFDIYNLLIGVIIFFLFVFKKDIFIKLCKRFRIKHPMIDRLETQSSTNQTKTTPNDKKPEINKNNIEIEMISV